MSTTGRNAGQELSDSLALPVFADAEARALEAERVAAEQRLEEQRRLEQEHLAAARASERAAAKARESITVLQATVTETERAIDDAIHTQQLAKIEAAQVQRMIRNARAEQAVADDAARSVSNSLIMLGVQRQQVEAKIGAAHAELASQKGQLEAQEDDAAAAARYAAADDVRIRELEKVRAQLDHAVRELEERAAAGDSETALMQTRIDRTATALAEIRRERDDRATELARAAALAAARRREITALEGEVEAALATVEMKKERIAAHNAEVERADASRREAEAARNADAAAAEAAAAEAAAAENSLADTRSLLAAVRGEVEGLVSGVRHGRAELTAAQNQLAQTEQALARAQAAEAQAKEMLEQLADRRMNAQQQLDGLEAELRELNSEISVKQSVLDRKQLEVHDASKGLSELFQKRSRLSADISGAEALLRRLRGRRAELSAGAADQAAHLYDADYRLQRLQRQLASVRGQLHDDASRRLRARCSDLEQQLEREKNNHTEISQQIAAVEADMRRTIAATEKVQQQLAQADDRVTALLADARGAEGQLRRVRRRLDDNIMTSDDCEMQLDTLRRQAEVAAAAAAAALEEAAAAGAGAAVRAVEAEADADETTALVKLLRIERQNLMAEVASARRRAAGLAARCELVQGRLERAAAVTGADEDGIDEKADMIAASALAAAGLDGDVPAPVAAQARLLMRVTQQRMALKERGDLLDSTIKKFERTNEKLQTQLTALIDLHRGHRAQHRPLGAQADSTELVNQIRNLENQRAGVARELVGRRRELARVKQLLAEQERVRSDAQAAQTTLARQRQAGRATLRARREELDSALGELARAIASYDEAHARLDVSGVDTLVAEVALLQQHNASAIQALLGISQRDRIFAADLGRLIHQN